MVGVLPELPVGDEPPEPLDLVALAGEERLDEVLAEDLGQRPAQYRECFAVVRCRYQGSVYSRCVYIWADTDFALVRGQYQGYPKKLGSIHQTRPHSFGRAAPRIGGDWEFRGIRPPRQGA